MATVTIFPIKKSIASIQLFGLIVAIVFLILEEHSLNFSSILTKSTDIEPKLHRLPPLQSYASKKKLFHNSASCLYPDQGVQLLSPRAHTPPSLRRYIKWHQSVRTCVDNDSCAWTPRTLIYTCGNTSQCSGVGDRMRGIRLLFLLAVASTRIFLIDWPTHGSNLYPLEVAFVPSNIDWRMPRTLQLNDSKASTYQFVDWTPKSFLAFNGSGRMDISKDDIFSYGRVSSHLYAMCERTTLDKSAPF